MVEKWLRNAYQLVWIKEGDEWKTTFNTPTGHYEYTVMPFGLTNAPAVFRAHINDVLRDMLNKFVFLFGRYSHFLSVNGGACSSFEAHASVSMGPLLVCQGQEM